MLEFFEFDFGKYANRIYKESNIFSKETTKVKPLNEVRSRFAYDCFVKKYYLFLTNFNKLKINKV
jgi:hypothetical protein